MVKFLVKYKWWLLIGALVLAYYWVKYKIAAEEAKVAAVVTTATDATGGFFAGFADAFKFW